MHNSYGTTAVIVNVMADGMTWVSLCHQMHGDALLQLWVFVSPLWLFHHAGLWVSINPFLLKSVPVCTIFVGLWSHMFQAPSKMQRDSERLVLYLI